MLALLGWAALAVALAPSNDGANDGPRGGNERVLLVANGASGLSLALARRYAELRRIPIEHLLVLDDVPGGGTASADPIALADCRERILAPILGWLAEQQLADEIDAIVYSSGFPHAVDVAAAAQDRKAPQVIGGVASLTGLTYFARDVLRNDLSCLGLRENGYCRDDERASGGELAPSRGFGCDPAGRGRHYLSTFLAWLGPYGTSFDEAVAQLERSTAADGSAPRGTIYFLKNGDVRATTREPRFAAAIRELEKRGQPAALLEAGRDGEDGVLPKKKGDVLGAMLGIADFDWNACGSTIVPGAIVEHLTSFGASFQIGGQTKLTALLRAGAAGASGTVTEPYAIQEKFPTPFVHVRYVDGCSLAESFFASVAGPYQLLVVGDACCRPFGRYPAIEAPIDAALRAIGPAGEPWRGTVRLAPAFAAGEVERLEAWVDGRRIASSEAGGELAIETTQLADGGHELHLVAVGPAPIGVTSSLVRPILVANGAAILTLQGPTQPVTLGEKLELRGKAPAGATVELREGTRKLAEVVARGGGYTVELSSLPLGPGRCRLRAHATIAGSGAISSSLFEGTIVVPSLESTAGEPGDLLPGFALDVGGKTKAQQRGVLAGAAPLPLGAPVSIGARAGATAHGTLRGWVSLPAAGLHEWSVAEGTLTGLKLDGRRCVEGTSPAAASGGSFVARLATGWHSFELELDGAAGRSPRLSLVGPNGPVVLAEGTAGHGPGGLKRVRREQLLPKEAGWCDGDRATAIAAKGDPKGDVEVELKGGGRLEAIAVYVASALPIGDRLREGLVIEGRDGGAWWTLPAEEIRVIHGSATAPSTNGVACLVWSGPTRRTRRLRIRASAKEMEPSAAVCEVECWESAGRR